MHMCYNYHAHAHIVHNTCEDNMTSSLVWPDLSSTQGILVFSISDCAEEFTGQNGSVVPQTLWGDNW